MIQGLKDLAPALPGSSQLQPLDECELFIEWDEVELS